MNLMMKKILNFYKKLGFIHGAIFTICLTSAISIATVTIPGFYTFTAGTPISASQVNSNFDKLSALIDNSRSQNFIGGWDASINSPGIESSPPNAGDYFIVNTAGAHIFSNGDSITFAVGDWAIFNGISWEKIQAAVGASQWITNAGNIYFSTGNVGVGTTAPAAKLDVKGTLRLSGSTSGFVGLAPAANAGSTVYTLPTADGTVGQVLNTNGSGILSWVTPATGGAPTGSAGGDLSGTYPNPTITALSAAKISSGVVDNLEFNYLDGVTSSIQSQLNSKEGTITASGTTNYYRGDKTWQPLNTSVVPENTNLYFTNARVLAVPLTGFSALNAVITSADTALAAFNKAQGQITNLNNDYVSKSGTSITTGTMAFSGAAALTVQNPVNLLDVANKQYVDGMSHWASNGPDINRLTGKVGIGTTTPGEMLHVETTTFNGPASVLIKNTSNLSGSQAQFVAGNETAYTAKFGISSTNFSAGGALDSAYLNSSAPNGLNISTSYSGTPIRVWTGGGVPFERMRIDDAGNVGIGTTSPVNHLSVSSIGTNDIANFFNSVNTAGITVNSLNTRQSVINLLNTGNPSDSLTSGSPPVGWQIFSNGSTFPSYPSRFGITHFDGTTWYNPLIINQTGQVGINLPSGSLPGFALDVNGSIAAVGTLQTHSDKRLKKNIVTVTDALEKLAALSGVYFDWKKNEYPEMNFEGGRQMGVIAQDVEKVFPEAVSKNQKGIRSVAYSMLIAPIIEAIKELSQKMTFMENTKADKADFIQMQREFTEVKTVNALILEENAAMKDALCELGKKTFCK